MILFVDTSVWSLFLRRDRPIVTSEVGALRIALEQGVSLATTGLVLQELLQGFAGPKSRREIIRRFSTLPCMFPQRQDHIEAAELRNNCRRAGLQIGTVDALLAQLCVANEMTLLTADRDFVRMARHCDLKVWEPSPETRPQ